MNFTPEVDVFGNVYKGDQRKGKRHGNGLLVYTNGDSYKGEFQFDLPHGTGKYISNDGESIYEGIWKKGILVQKTHVVKSKQLGWTELVTNVDHMVNQGQSNKVPEVLYFMNTEKSFGNTTSEQREDTSEQFAHKLSQRSLSRPRSQLRSSSPSPKLTPRIGNSCKKAFPISPTFLKSTSPVKSYVARRVRSMSPSHQNWTRSTSYKTIDASEPSPTNQKILKQGLKTYSSPIKMSGRIEPPKRPAHIQSALKYG